MSGVLALSKPLELLRRFGNSNREELQHHMCNAVYREVEELIGQHGQLIERFSQVFGLSWRQRFIDSVDVMKLVSNHGARFRFV
mgnify:FL=1